MATEADLKKELDDLNKKIRDAGGGFRQDMNAFIASFGSGVSAVEKAVKSLRTEFRGLDTDVNYYYESLKKVVAELNNQNNALSLTKKAFSNLSSIANKLKYDQDGISELNKKDLKSLAQKLVIQKAELTVAKTMNKDRLEQIAKELQSVDTKSREAKALRKERKEIKDAQSETKKFLADAELGYAGVERALRARLKLEEQIARAMGISGTAVTALATGLSKLGVDTSSIAEKMRVTARYAVETKQSFAQLRVLGTGLNEIVRSLGRSLTDPAAIIALFAKNIGRASTEITALGKSFGISANLAKNVREDVVAFAKATNDGYVTTSKLLKAQTELTDELGIAVKYSNEELVTFSKLTGIVGLTASEAAKLDLASAGANQNLQEYIDNIRISTYYTQQQTKTHFTDKQILQEISKLSAGILVKFKENPTAIAEAVVQAKKLGTTLEGVDKIGESMLNFESSIQSQMEAELITGRALNLEKARYAALTGDQLTLEKEIASQVGSLADYQKLNVIAQKSLAQAFGMSREEMSEMLLKQEAITKYGDKAAELNAAQAKDLLKSGKTLKDYLQDQDTQRSIQEKFNSLVEKLEQTLTDIASGPIAVMLGQFIDLLDKAGALQGILLGVAAIWSASIVIPVLRTIGAVTGLNKVLLENKTIQQAIAGYESVQLSVEGERLTLQEALVMMKGEELATQIGIAAAWAVANPLYALAGLAVAGTAVAGLYSLIAGSKSKTEFADGGIVTSRIDNATVGEAGPEAIIPLNSPRANNILGNGGNNQDTAMLVSALADLRSSIHKVADRPVNIQVDGQTLANTVAKNVPTSYGNLLNPSSRVYGG
jgi:hypothetical protein